MYLIQTPAPGLEETGAKGRKVENLISLDFLGSVGQHRVKPWQILLTLSWEPEER